MHDQIHSGLESEVKTTIRIRPAVPADAEAMAALILELAAYERLTHEAAPDADMLRIHLSATGYPRCEALIAETGDKRAVGFALFFYNYSTFLTRWGIYLEDLYVQPAFRGQGAGYALFKRVAETAVERKCGRLEWSVLDWNEPAISFYRKLGARPMDEWTVMRLAGDDLLRVGRP